MIAQSGNGLWSDPIQLVIVGLAIAAIVGQVLGSFRRSSVADWRATAEAASARAAEAERNAAECRVRAEEKGRVIDKLESQNKELLARPNLAAVLEVIDRITQQGREQYETAMAIVGQSFKEISAEHEKQNYVLEGLAESVDKSTHLIERIAREWNGTAR